MQNFNNQPESNVLQFRNPKVLELEKNLNAISFHGMSDEEVLAIASKTKVGNFNTIDNEWNIDPTTGTSQKCEELINSVKENGITESSYHALVTEIVTIIKAREEVAHRKLAKNLNDSNQEHSQV